MIQCAFFFLQYKPGFKFCSCLGITKQKHYLFPYPNARASQSTEGRLVGHVCARFCGRRVKVCPPGTERSPWRCQGANTACSADASLGRSALYLYIKLQVQQPVCIRVRVVGQSLISFRMGVDLVTGWLACGGSSYSVTRLQAPGLQLWAEADLLRVERRKGVVKPGLSLPSRNGSVVGKE